MTQISFDQSYVMEIPYSQMHWSGDRAMTDVEHIRLRPGMYMRYRTHRVNLDHGTAAVVDLIDAALDSFPGPTRLCVQVDDQNLVTVWHDAPRNPLGPATTDLSADYYRAISRHSHAPVVAIAFSEFSEIELIRDGLRQRQTFADGYAMAPATTIATDLPDSFRVSFCLDRRYLPEPVQWSVVAARLTEVAYLQPELTVECQVPGHRDAGPVSPEHGLAELVRLNAQDSPAVTPVLTGVAEIDGFRLEVALEFLEETLPEPVVCYANTQLMPRGGSYVPGFLKGLAEGLNQHARRNRGGRSTMPNGRDYASQVSAVISARTNELQPGPQIWDRCVNPEFAALAAHAVRAALDPWLATQRQQVAQVLNNAWERFRLRKAPRAQRTTPASPVTRGRIAAHG